MPATNENADLLVRLGYDPTDLHAGLQQATQDVQNYKAQATLLSTELKATKTRLQTEYTAEFLRQTQQRINGLLHEYSQTTGAMGHADAARKAELAAQARDIRTQIADQRQVLTSYQTQIQRVRQLTVAQTEMANKARQASAAAGLFNLAGGAGGVSARTNSAIGQLIEQFRLRVGQNIPGVGYLRGFVPVGQDLEAVGAKVNSALGGMALPILGITAAFAGLSFAVGETVRHMMSFAESVANTSAATGLGFGPVQQFNELAKILDLDAQTLSMAFARIQSQIGEFLTTGSLSGSGGSQFLLKVLAQLNVSLRDTAGNVRPVIDVLSDFYDALQKIPDQNERTALTLEAFGTRGRIIAQVFGEAQRSGESFREVMDRVAKVALPDDQINSLLREKTAWDNLVIAVDAAIKKVESFIAIRMLGFGPSKSSMPEPSYLSTLFAFNPAASYAAQEQAWANQMVSGLPLSPGTGFDASAAIAALQAQRKKANQMLAQFQAGGPLQYELKQKESELSAAANTGDTERLQILMSQIDALKQQIKNQQESVRLIEQANKALDAALAKYREMTAGLRTGPGGPFGTVAPDVAAALNKRISEAVLKSGVNVPLSSFGLYGFTGFHGAPPAMLPPSISGPPPGGNALSSLLALLGSPEGPRPVPGALPLSQFQQPFTALQSQFSVGLIGAEKYIDLLKQVETPLEAEIRLRSQAADMTDKQRQDLQKMLDLLQKINAAEKGAFADTGVGSLLAGFKDIADIVGKFSAGLNKSLSEGQASFEVISSSLKALTKGTGAKSNIDAIGKGLAEAFAGNFKDLGATSEVLGSFVTGIASIITGPGGALGALNGALTGAEMGSFLPGPGTAIGAAVGGIAGIFGSGKAKKRAQDIANNIVEAANKITQALNLSAIDLKTAIAQLQAQLAAANQIHGKGTKEIKQQTVDSLTSQINQLEAQQQQILESFRQTLANAELPSGMDSLAQQLEQIAKTLKDAAGAGATAAEQIDYLNAAMKNLTQSLGDTLTDEEQNLLGLMSQDADIRQQQKDLLVNEASQIASVTGGLGVGRTWTPAEQAALQIKQIKLQANQQLIQLQDQQKLLDAQIDGEAQLYGLSMQDLDAANAKALILQKQLDITKQIAAETDATIKAEMQWYQELLSGKIPNLPVGALPPGFSWPTGGGSNFTFADGAIQINVNGATDANQLASQLKQAILQTLRRQQVGLQ